MKGNKRIQSQSSSLSPNSQDFLYGVKSHGGRLVWKAMTHRLQEKDTSSQLIQLQHIQAGIRGKNNSNLKKCNPLVTKQTV